MSKFVSFCDGAMIFAVCALIFFLPISIAFVEAFTGIAVFFFLLKRIVAVFYRGTFAAEISFRERWQRFYGAVRPVDTGLNRWLAVFVFINVVSALWSIAPAVSWKAMGPKLLERCLLFFAIVEVMKTPRRIQWFCSLFFFSGLVVCASGLYQFIFGKDFLRGYALAEDRVRASFNHPNSFGLYLVVLLPILLSAIFFFMMKIRLGLFARKTEVSRRQNGGPAKSFWKISPLFLFLIISFVAGLLSLGFTFSRGAWLGFSVAVVVFFLMEKRVGVAGFLLIGVFLFVFIPLSAKTRQIVFPTVLKVQTEPPRMAVGVNDGSYMTDQGGSFDGSISWRGLHGRELFWREALAVIKNRPVLGAGLNTYNKAVDRFAPKKEWYFHYYAHNCYLQMAAEIGLVGLAAFLLFVSAISRRAWGRISKTGESWLSFLLFGVVAGFAGFLTCCFFDTGFYGVQFNTLFWILCGLIVTLSQFPPEKYAQAY